MKLLFVMRHSGYVRNFESTLRLLCDRGHDVHVLFQGKVKYWQLDPSDIADELAAKYPRFTFGGAPTRSDGWGLLGKQLRLGVDYLRYLEPEYDQAPKLRERALRAAPPDIVERAARGPLRSTPGRRAYMAWLRVQNQAIPTDPAIDALLKQQAPDVLVVTPLIEPGAPQAEYLRSARALGIRTAYCVASWDNLTNKGLIHGPVDLVTVWNDVMKREAVRMHGMSPKRVVVTGAAAFDHWFGWSPSRGRKEFCAEAKLPLKRPYLLYVCSSKFVAPDEVTFVRSWLARLRESPGALRQAGVLVRPHPQNAEQWADVDLQEFEPVSIWPMPPEAPVDQRTRDNYFDSIYHSAAVVGINTTAEIESAIVGRPVYSLLAPEFKDTQEGTLHFRHLREVNGGVLHLATGFDEHFAQLAGALDPAAAPDPRSRKFIEAFVRPHGIQSAATPRLADALQELAARPAVRGGDPAWAAPLRRRLEPLAAALAHAAQTQPDSFAATLAGKDARKEAQFAAWVAAREARKAEKTIASRRKQEAAARIDRIEQIVTEFGRLGVIDRRTIVAGITDAIPHECFVDLHAADPPWKLDYEEADIYLRVFSKTEVFRINACQKEPFTIRWIHDRIAPDDVFYDIGANVGAYSLVAAMKPGGGARVYAFEASLPNIGSLTANIVLNQVGDRISVMPVALSDRTAMDVFHLRDAQPGGARHALGDESPEGPTELRQAVMVYRLDDLVERFNLPAPQHIKMDVDGGELALLNGAVRTLQSPALRSLLIEVSTSLSDAVTGVLERCGLRLESRILKRNKAGEYAVWYGIFGRGEPGGPVTTTDYADSGKP